MYWHFWAKKRSTSDKKKHLNKFDAIFELFESFCLWKNYRLFGDGSVKVRWRKLWTLTWSLKFRNVSNFTQFSTVFHSTNPGLFNQICKNQHQYCLRLWWVWKKAGTVTSFQSGNAQGTSFSRLEEISGLSRFCCTFTCTFYKGHRFITCTYIRVKTTCL